MVTEEQKDKMGEILFGMIAVAMEEVNHHMAFPTWQAVDKETRASYMSVVAQLVAATEVKTEPTVQEIITAEQNLTAQPVLSTQIKAGSDLLASILAEQPDKPLRLAPSPPSVIQKQKVNDRMAKARAARKANQSRKEKELVNA